MTQPRDFGFGSDEEMTKTLARKLLAERSPVDRLRAVRLHGGIGFTWDCDVHLFFKRAKHNQFLFGDGRHHRRELAKLVLGQPEKAISHVHTPR